MIDTVSALALGALGGMTLTGALMQILVLNPARKSIAAASDALDHKDAEIKRQRTVIECWREAHDRLEQEAAVSNRDVVALLANKKFLESEVERLTPKHGPDGKFAPKLKAA